MVPSSFSDTRKKLKDILDVTTNVVVVLFAVVAIGVLVKNYFAPQSAKPSVTVTKGSVFPEIVGVDYKQTTRTLILALNVDCRYWLLREEWQHRMRNLQRGTRPA